ncbi:alpha/beta fold hydrolase [Bacillus cihuensis]|uniref:alpha/beta fold hydrolase n=1 Tax=Bacillus cihuensis TaxID=1208599 RepID=UPI00042792A9|nr:alpha/beta fold hydrolase [Bacillus cihuensis]
MVKRKTDPKKSSKLQSFLDIRNQEMPEMMMTPRIAVWKKNKATLWHYPAKKKRYNIPILIIYSIINRPYIFDLGPGNSLIGAFGKEGYDIYLLDFGIPGYEDGNISIDEYILDYIQKGVQRVLRHSGAKEISLLGSCIGGTLAAIYAAIAEEPIRNLILTVAPIDFEQVPQFDQWSEAMREGKVSFDEILDVFQIVPAKAVKSGLRLMTSPVYISPLLSLLNRADDEEYVKWWRRFNAWTNDYIPLTSGAVKQMTHDLIIDNKLIKGTLKIRGKKAKLNRIKANLLVIASQNDRLVPNAMISPIMGAVSSPDKTLHLLESGHAQMLYDDTLPVYYKEWLPERSGPISQ